MILCANCDGSCILIFNGYLCNRCRSVYLHCHCIDHILEEKKSDSVYDYVSDDDNLVLPNTHRVIGWSIIKEYLPEDFNLEQAQITDIPEKFISDFNYLTEDHAFFTCKYKPQMIDEFTYEVIPTTSWVVHCRECEEVQHTEYLRI